MRTIAFKIADGYVEVSVRYDRNRVLNAARDVGEQAGDRFAKNFRDSTARRSLFDQRVVGGQSRRIFGESGRRAGTRFSSMFDDEMTKRFRAVGERSQARFVGGFGKGLEKRTEAAGRRGGGAFSKGFRVSVMNGTDKFGRTFRRAMGSHISLTVGGLVAIIAGIVALLPPIGAAMAGALTIGFAGGIAAIGIVAAAQAKKVRKRFAKLKDQIGSDMKDIAKPYEGVLIAFANDVQKAFDDLKPHLADFFEGTAPTLETFSEKVVGAFGDWGFVIDDARDAFNALMKHFSPELEAIIGEIGDAFSELFKVVEENPKVFSDILGFILRIIPGIIKLITWLAEKWVSLVNTWNAEGSKLKATVTGIAAFIGGAFKGVGEFIKGAFKAVVGIVTGIINFVKNAAMGIFKIITGLAQFDMTMFLDGVKQLGMALLNLIKTLFLAVADLAMGAVKGIWRIIEGLFQAFGGNAKEFFLGLWQTITGTFSSLWGSVSSSLARLGRGVIAWFVNLGSMIKAALVTLWNILTRPWKAFYNWLVGNSLVPDMVRAVVSWFGNLWRNVKRIFTNLFNKAKEIWGNLRDAVVGRVVAMGLRVMNRFKQLKARAQILWNRFRRWIVDKFTDIRDAVVGRVVGMALRIMNRFKQLKARAQILWNRFRRWIVDKFTDIRDAVVNRVTALRTRVMDNFRNLRDRAKNLWSNFKGWLDDKAAAIRDGVVGKFRDLRDKAIAAFRAAKDGIGDVWKKIRSKTKGPVNFVIGTVFNEGVLKFWNAIAGKIGMKKMDPLKKLARGGILPGTSRAAQGDDQLVAMRRGEGVTVSEALRDPYERARLQEVNNRALNGKSLKPIQEADNWRQVSKRAMSNGIAFKPNPMDADQQGGNPKGFALGGILGKVKDKVKDSWTNIAGNIAGWAKGPINGLVGTLKEKFGSGGFAGLPYKAVSHLKDQLFSFFQRKDDEYNMSGGTWTNASARLKAALKWAKTQNGKPYQWGGGGNPSWDCSGFIAGIQKHLMGQKPRGRLYTTFNFTGRSSPRGWKKGKKSPFMVGVTNKGVGHMAGSLIGTPVEASGGKGVRVGGSARDHTDSMFSNKFGYTPVIGEATPGGGGAGGNWSAIVKSVLKSLGISTRHASNVLKAINKESGGNPRAVNNWDCLPLDTQILTRRGLISHDQVRAGDETIGFNPETGKSEWTRITRVVHYEDADTVRIGNKRWSVESTPNHRWLTQSRRGTLSMRTSEDLGNSTVILSREADTGGGLPITVEEASLLGWIAGDGHVEAGRRGPSASVSQSKREHFTAIEKALVGTPHARYEYPDRTSAVTWRLEPEAFRSLVSRCGGHPKQDAESMVLAMSSEQRWAWLEAMVQAEGHSNGGYTVVYQNQGPVADALRLAIYLTGNRPSIGTLSGKDQWAPCNVYGITKPMVGPTNRFVEEAPVQDVWCVTTDLGTWTAEQKGQMFLTGNSNAMRGTPSKGLLQTIGPTFRAFAGKHRSKGIFDPYANIYAAVNYARSRYGSGWSARMAAPGGYAGGGKVLPKKWAMVGENGPEAIRTGAHETATVASNGGGDTYIINGDIKIDASTIKDISDLKKVFEGVRPTSRKHGGRQE